MNDTVVYRHRKPNGEVFYVGIGNKKRPYSKGRRNQFWYNVVKKWGYEVEVVATGLSWVDACDLEELLIEEYGRRDLGNGTLVNMTDGGEGVKNPSEEIRQKLSATKSGKNNPMYGKKHSKETREKMSAANSGENAPWYGKKFSKEYRQKLSSAKSGKKLSKEHRQKISTGHQKLTFEQAEEIRKRYQTEKTTYQKLAQEYRVSHMTIGNIINKKLYKK